MGNDLIIANTETLIPVQVAAAGEQAAIRFIEFFTANIRNPNTRAAYARAVSDFFRWCEGRGLDRLNAVRPVHVAGYVEELGKTRAAPSVKQHLAAVRMLYDWLVVGQVVRGNPASVVRGPKHVIKRGKTPVLSPEEARELFEAAEFVTPNSASRAPIFLGAEKTVTFVRVANAPGTAPRLEFVKLAETVDERGFALVRSHAPFKLLDPKRPFEQQLYFADPVVLVRAPFRVSFAFAGADRRWQGSWRDPALLPSAARIQVRDVATDKVLAVSTATLLHVDLPAECVTKKSVQQCIDGIRAPVSAEGSAPPSTPVTKPPAGSAP